MKVLNLSQIRAAEENAVSNGIFSYTELMKNAGRAATEIIKSRYAVYGKKITVVCGVGNNGGDGLVIASLLSCEGACVSVALPLGDVKTETARAMYPLPPDISVSKEIDPCCDIIIDALFGIGLTRAPEGDAADAIDRMNMCEGVRIAIDTPSGVMCDGGVPGRAFKADLTVTFIALKPCQLLPPSSEYCGETLVADIGAEPLSYEYLTIEPLSKQKRAKNSHKGSFGTALIIAGSYGMCGAEILATLSALRSGVGIAKAIVCDKNYTALTSCVPEAVTVPVPTTMQGAPQVSDRELEAALSSADAVLIGCGLGRSEDAVRLVKRTLQTINIPVIIDADGINALCNDINIIGKIKAPVILTPHPGEMARLCKTTVSNIESDRVEYARSLAQNQGCVVVLKGANTVVASPHGRVYINTTGNPGLATGGSGDVLSGIIVSKLAQGKNALTVALEAVWLHGTAADNALCHTSEDALLPRDIIEELKRL